MPPEMERWADALVQAMTNARLVPGQVSTLSSKKADITHRMKWQETAEGKLFVDAAKAAKVQLLVWSGLPPVTKNSGGKYKHVFFFEEKAEVTKYAKSTGVPFVSVEAGCYMQNYLYYLRPAKQADGTFAIITSGSPDTPLPLIDTDNDYGLFVRKAIEQNAESGSEIYAWSEMISNNNIARVLGEGPSFPFTTRTIVPLTPQRF